MKRQKDLKLAGEQNSKAFQDVAAQIRATKDALKENTSQIDANIKALNQSKNSLEQNKGLLESLKEKYLQLSKSQGNSSKEAQALNVQIGQLTNTITHQEEKLDKSRKVFDLHKQTNDAFRTSFDKIKDTTGTFGPSLQDAAEGFNAMKTGLSAVKTGFDTVGGAIKTTGFGLLVIVLQSVVEYFTKTKEGARKLKAIVSAVGVVIQTFKDKMATLGKIIVGAFTHPVESIKQLGKAIVNNVINRFKGLAVILDGLKNLDIKKISNGVLQSITGVTDVADKAVKAFKAVDAAIKTTNATNNKAHADEKKRSDERIQMYKKENHEKRQIKNDGKSKKKSESPTSILEAKSLDISDSVQLAKQGYDTELSLLNEQLDKKLVSEAEYNVKSQQLKEKYHAAIGGTLVNFAKTDLDLTIKVQKQVVEQNQKSITQYEEEQKEYRQQRKDFEIQTAQSISNASFSILKNSLQSQSQAKIKQLETQKASELNNSSLTGSQKKAIEEKYRKKEIEEKTKAFKAEQRASLLQAVINGALAITKATSQTGVLAPFVIPGIIAETAIQVATITAQKTPQYAMGGLYYQSDGKGALLPGYSRTDNTNAYLRSGEAVVVSEAMRNPWARNLVSAINVAHGGRDFSVANSGRGYAIGGIFTDGGNSNRYYNQPMNDQKDLANTIAYQMINNFPPVYVDVKDINSQQSILAQTVNRVNL